MPEIGHSVKYHFLNRSHPHSGHGLCRQPLLPRMGLRAGSSRLLLLSSCQHRFKMRRLFFARDDADFNSLEAGLLQPAMQVAFRKAKPAVTIKFARALEAVREQI